MPTMTPRMLKTLFFACLVWTAAAVLSKMALVLRPAWRPMHWIIASETRLASIALLAGFASVMCFTLLFGLEAFLTVAAGKFIELNYNLVAKRLRRRSRKQLVKQEDIDDDS